MRAIEIIGPLFSPCEAARSVINYESGGKTGAADRLTFSEGILMLQKTPKHLFQQKYTGGFL